MRRNAIREWEAIWFSSFIEFDELFEKIEGLLAKKFSWSVGIGRWISVDILLIEASNSWHLADSCFTITDAEVELHWLILVESNKLESLKVDVDFWPVKLLLFGSSTLMFSCWDKLVGSKKHSKLGGRIFTESIICSDRISESVSLTEGRRERNESETLSDDVHSNNGTWPYRRTGSRIKELSAIPFFLNPRAPSRARCANNAHAIGPQPSDHQQLLELLQRFDGKSLRAVETIAFCLLFDLESLSL